LQRLPTWSLFLITNMPRFEKIVQKQATRRRKLFNGRIECCYYQFLGPKPPSMIRQPREQAEVQPTDSVASEVAPSNEVPTAPVQDQPSKPELTPEKPQRPKSIPVEVITTSATATNVTPPTNKTDHESRDSGTV